MTADQLVTRLHPDDRIDPDKCGPKMMRQVTVNIAESPIAWLARRKDAEGRPWLTPAEIAGLLDLALGLEIQTRHGGFQLLLICPPPVLETGALAGDFWGARVKSQALPSLLAALAASRGCGFLDAGQVIEVSAVDGVHFEAEAHRRLGLAVAEAVARL